MKVIGVIFTLSLSIACGDKDNNNYNVDNTDLFSNPASNNGTYYDPALNAFTKVALAGGDNTIYFRFSNMVIDESRSFAVAGSHSLRNFCLPANHLLKISISGTSNQIYIDPRVESRIVKTSIAGGNGIHVQSLQEDCFP